MQCFLRTALAAAAISVVALGGPAQAAKSKPLFAGDETLQLTLKGPLGGINRAMNAKPFAATLTVEGAAPETLPVMLSVRGITRRKKEICAFPPLRVTFNKPAETSLFSGQKHLKLVTYCQNTSPFDQQRLLEYSAYKLYNAMTPISFKVRLAKVSYVDDNGREIASRFGFFIEEISDVAKRNGLTHLGDVKKIAVSQLDPAAAARFTIFEYMISNLDWSDIANAAGLACCHNSRLLGAQDATGASSGLIPVPQDFDETGLVDAPYAAVPAGYPDVSVKVRRFGGFCVHNAQVQAYIAELQPRHAEFTGIFDKISEMNEGTRHTATRYIDSFFDRTATPQQVSDIQQTCLK